MGIFQEQFNNTLHNALSAKFTAVIAESIDPKPNDFENIAKNLEKNPEVQEVHAALNRLGAQALQDKVIKEQKAGQQAEQSKRQIIQNRVQAKRTPLTDKQFAKEFYTRAKPIVHGGKELTGGKE